ncbi:Brix-domain-containing protein [Coniochaeta sp. PMI_546]|nr:Brix-domain-containing protein [Coniochaeta sp. PMI_546]
MGSKRGGGSGRSLSLKTNNKLRRQQMYVEDKREANKSRHEERHRRKKEEDKDPELRRERLARNQTMTIEKKRVWDEGADEDTLGAAVDLAQAKRRRLEQEQAELLRLEEGAEEKGDDADSMLGSDDEEEEEDGDEDEENSARVERIRRKQAQRDASLAPSVAASLAPSTTSTNLELTPASLARKFPNLFSEDPLPTPKVLITTSINATIHKEAQDIATLFPNSHYIPRSAHRHGHKYSVREICKFARNRDFTAVVVINEDQKKPDRMTIVHLPEGPTLTYTISHYMPGKKIPGHGNPTNHYPELLLNNLRTSLGLLVGKSFHTLYPPQPEIQGRQVVTVHNQRDFIMIRRHRYVFRDKRATEKPVTSVEGEKIKGFEEIRVGLQALGPNLNVKLRRVDKGIGRAGSEGEDALQWEWKARMEKVRTRFNL